MKTSLDKWWEGNRIPLAPSIIAGVSPKQLLEIRRLVHKACLKGRRDERHSYAEYVIRSDRTITFLQSELKRLTGLDPD